MPNRPVIRDDKTTTKTRIVCDASSKGVDSLSLNESFSGELQNHWKNWLLEIQELTQLKIPRHKLWHTHHGKGSSPVEYFG